VDLLLATQHVLHNCGVKAESIHVKGHQDNKHIRPLTHDATLNVEADLLTRDKLNTYRHGPNPFHIPWSQGVCYRHNRRIEKAFNTKLQDHINGQTAQTYWIKRWELMQGIWKKIDWESISQAMQELPTNRRHWVAKYVSGHFAMGEICAGGSSDHLQSAPDAQTFKKIRYIF